MTAAVTRIPGAEHASVTLLAGDLPAALVVTDELTRAVERCQHVTGEGPSSAATRESPQVVRVDDLRADTRWPRFAAAVATLPVRSAVSFPLYLVGGAGIRTVGALTVYARPPHAFTNDSVHAGTLLATYTSVAVAPAGRTANLPVFDYFEVTPEQAVRLLVALSQPARLPTPWRRRRRPAGHVAPRPAVPGPRRPATGEAPVPARR